jgi:hypothetical protein|tara:strand:+ start:71 stop:703 length:633 start_codon:yes stop_codon:yes gene_type:complete
MSLENRFRDFQTEYNLDDEAMGKMLGLFNDAFIDVARKLLETNTSNTGNVKKTTTVNKTTSSSSFVKRFATKIAAEYARENNLTLDDFDIGTLKDGKVTKSDINTVLKANKLTAKKAPVLKTEKNSSEEKELWYKTQDNVKTEKNTNKCHGMNKSGDPCKQPGTTKPDGAQNFYCFRHGIEWKNFEVSSDSDLEEEPIEKEITCTIVDSE